MPTMPKIETPEEFAVIMDSLVVSLDDVPNLYLTRQKKANLIAARDALFRAESVALLKTCGEALVVANRNCPPGGISEIKTGAALAALREARVL